MRSSVDPRRNALLLLALLLPCAGCNELHNSYVVEMRPTEAGVERRVTACRYDSSRTQHAARVEAIVADRLSRAYGARPDTLRPYTAQGRFADIPEDVGNWGAYRAERTLLGFSAVYVERFRGNPHAVEVVGRPLVAADSMFDLVRTWCAAELGQQAGWPALNAHLEAEVRAPLRDIASAGFLADLSDSRHGPYETMRYEHPELLTLLSGGLEFEGTIIPFYSQASMLDRVRVRFARVLGLRTPAESRRVLAFLVDRESAEASMLRAVGTARKLPPDKVRELWTSTLSRIWFDSDLDETSVDSLVVRFETASEPYDTNGQWDAVSRSVVWRATVPTPEDGAWSLPIHCRASWSVPDSVRQRRLLGSVRLDGEDLASYCTLFTNLDAKHQREWDRAVMALRPGKLSSLRRFRFADERARGMAAGDSTSRAYPLVRLIVDAGRGGR